MYNEFINNIKETVIIVNEVRKYNALITSELERDHNDGSELTSILSEAEPIFKQFENEMLKETHTGNEEIDPVAVAALGANILRLKRRLLVHEMTEEQTKGKGK